MLVQYLLGLYAVIIFPKNSEHSEISDILDVKRIEA